MSNYFFTLAKNVNANIVYIRIRKNDGDDVVITSIVNRWHDNVAFLFKEKSTLNPDKNNANFIEGFLGSYPNYFLDIRQDDLPDFFDLLTNMEEWNPEAQKRFDKYGINRSDEKFWEYYDWFQHRFDRDQPVHSGLFDLNRYYNVAL